MAAYGALSRLRGRRLPAKRTGFFIVCSFFCARMGGEGAWKMKLLLAEDELPLSQALTAILRKNLYQVDAVHDGRTALEYLRCGGYDGAILDVMMPGMDGISVLRRLREQDADLPVLLLTAKSSVEDKVLGLDSGANDYLTKPFATQEMLARVRAMTRSRPGQSAMLLRAGNLCLSRASFEVSSPQGSFRLTKREFQMLEMLLSNPSRLISTQRFWDNIWGGEDAAGIHVVWVYISYLRIKLAALGADMEIRAHRNAGYSLEKKRPGRGANR